MSQRGFPAQQVQVAIDALFASGRELGGVLETMDRLGVGLVMQAGLELEVSECLGRDRNAHGQRCHVGQRNGYGPLTVKAMARVMALARPKLRNTDDTLASCLLASGVSRTAAPESLVIAGFRGSEPVLRAAAALSGLVHERRNPAPGHPHLARGAVGADR